MTDSEWLQGADPLPMLLWLRGKGTERQLRRFAAGCCRLWGGLNTDGRAAEALKAVERSAEGQIDADELRAANKQAWRSFDLSLPENAANNATGDASHADLALMLTHKDAWHSSYCVSWIIRCKMRGEMAAQCDLLRNVFGVQISSISGAAASAEPGAAPDPAGT